MQRFLVERSIRSAFYEVITDRSKGIPLKVQRELFSFKYRTIDASTAQFGPQISHNFNFSRLLSEFLVIVAAFIWNTELTFGLVAKTLKME